MDNDQMLLYRLSRRRLLQAAAATIVPTGCTEIDHSQQAVGTLQTESLSVEAPFDMPVIRIPDFSKVRVFDIRDYGAQPHDLSANSAAIEQAIGLASQAGGGRVLIPSGEWSCGKIHLKSNVNLHLDDDATLLFSENPNDYLPAVMTTWEGLECYNYSPLIYAFECKNIAITGKGKLQAKLDVWRIWYERTQEHLDAIAALYHMASKDVAVVERVMTYEGANLRPHFVQFNRCRHVLIEDVSIENSPFWVLHPYLTEEVVIRRVNVKAHGHNNDGVDPEMTQSMLVENCVFDQGDDAIAVKSGRNQDAWRLNTPCKNIVVRNCRIKQAHQLLAIGSELSGGIENVFVHNCQFDDGTAYEGTGNLVFIKTNERRGGFVRNIWVKDITAKTIGGGALDIATDVLYQWRDLVPTYERRLTEIEHVYLSNFLIDQANYLCKISGDAELPVKSVALSNIKVKITVENPVQNSNVVDFTMA